jgi:transposase InsO family protein
VIDQVHESSSRQAELLDIPRYSVSVLPQPMPGSGLQLMRRINEPLMVHCIVGALMLHDMRRLGIGRPNQVWGMDASYFPMQFGFVHLSAVIGWATRRVLAWCISSMP